MFRKVNRFYFRFEVKRPTNKNPIAAPQKVINQGFDLIGHAPDAQPTL